MSSLHVQHITMLKMISQKCKFDLISYYMFQLRIIHPLLNFLSTNSKNTCPITFMSQLVTF